MSRSRRGSKRQREAAALREARGLLARSAHTRRRRPPSGAAPGEFVVPEDAPGPSLSAMCYAHDALEEHSVEDAHELRTLIQRSDRVTWIDIVGFGDGRALEQIGDALGIHQLAMADVVNIPQRPKAELYDDRLLVVTQMARMTESGAIDIEQVTLVLGPNWVASFQEHAGDVFDPVRARIRSPQTRIRDERADFLMYALIDAVIDGYFPVVEAIANTIDELEEVVISKPNHVSLARIHAMRRRVLNLHRVQWRQRDAIHSLLRDEAMPFSERVKPYLRDTHDHAFQTLDAIESFREMLVGLIELQLSSASHRLNEVMKTLTIVATIFIPLTFLAGVYGMNFDYMPELRWRWGYAAVWLSFVVTAVAFLLWFRRRGWIGNRDDTR
ncbi:MAG TPA: magnesium/cobalt transporter CorA [Myxococcota bacterium]|nr:magnesium/cobalt transporter CorA [Myxococcota bacterium]